MVIDAHQHFWRIGRNDCRWPTPDLPAICRDVEPAHLRALAEPLGVTGSVLVQSQESARDTAYLLELAGDEPFVLGVVGWTELKATDAPRSVAALAGRPKLRGLRPMLQGLPVDWIADPALQPGVDAMVEHGLGFDALVYPRHLPRLAEFARRNPGLRIVIDHAAKPPIESGNLSGWAAAIAPFGDLPNVWCKLSGLLTEAGPAPHESQIAWCVGHLLHVFGADRLMWGSDWPVVELAGDYAAWLGQARRLVDDLAPEARVRVFGENAKRFYGL